MNNSLIYSKRGSQYFVFLFFAFYLLFNSCQQKKKSDETVILVGSSIANSSIELTDRSIIDIIGYTIAENDILGNPLDILKNDSDLIIFDNKLHQIFICDTLGQIKKIIKPEGAGPKEFEFIESYALDDLKNSIKIFDSKNFRIQEYDLDGNFISSSKTEFFYRDILKVNDQWFVTNGWANSILDPYILKADSNLTIQEEVLKTTSKFTSLIANSNPMTTIDEGILINQPLSNDIHFYNGTTSKLYSLDFGKFAFPNLNGFNSFRDFYTEIIKGEYIGWIREPLYLNKQAFSFMYISSNGSGKTKGHIGIYNNGELITTNKIQIRGMPLPYPKLLYNGICYSIITEEEYNYLIDESPFSEEDKSFWTEQFKSKDFLIITFKMASLWETN